MKVFIGCSSSEYIDSKYVEDCKNLLSVLLKENDLVFGADDAGLMGLSYHIAKENGRKVIGVCPKRYRDDFKKLNCDVEVVTDTVSDRTYQAICHSDVMVFLPGGVGTIYEFFSALESKRSHEHDKPIILYNSCGYFDKMLLMLDQVYQKKFTSFDIKKHYFVCNKIDDVLKVLNDCMKY